MKINNVFFNGDYSIEHLDNGLKTLSFKIYTNDIAYNECIPEAIVEDTLFYKIKSVDDNGMYLIVDCELNLNTFKETKQKTRKFENLTLLEVLNMVKKDYTLIGTFKEERKTFEVNNSSKYDVIMEAQKQYGAFFEFDNKAKTITIQYQDEIEYRGLYITEQLNIISTDNQSDTYDFFTRIYALGKDDITFASVNEGKDYVEDFSYSNELISGIIVDTTISDPNTLLNLATNTLAEKSKPCESYTFQVFNLSKLSKDDYSLKDVKVNDIVKYIDRKRKREVYHRVVKYKEFPNNPSKDEITLGNNKSTSVASAILNATNITNVTFSNLDVYDRAVLYTNDVIRAFKENGYIYQTGNEIYILDKLPKEEATNIIRFNKDGISFSSSFNGVYTKGYTGTMPINNKTATFESGILKTYV